jgi:DNA-binding transcriptional MerR regulator
MKGYTVNELATIAGVSVRTLHYYDEIGLLKPRTRSDSGYRLYGEKELRKLQQILFFREFDFPLMEIAATIDSPDFDPVESLSNHRVVIEKRMDRLSTLLDTIDKTIKEYKGEHTMLTDKELYEGLTPEQAEKYTKEAERLFDPEIVKNVNKKIRGWSKEKWNSVKSEGQGIYEELGALLEKTSASSEETQKVIARHHAHIERFFEAPFEVYRGLGAGYADHPDFRAFYDHIKPGLADYIKEAIDCYCDYVLGKKKE